MLVLPYPTSPTNGQTLDATPVLANIQAIAQAIQSFDASQVQAGTLVAAAFNASINPNTLLKETTVPFVQTGLIWSTVSGLNGTMSGGIVYINGIRVPVNSVASNAFAASKDVYVDVDVNGNITYNAVANGAAAPALGANSIRIAKVVTAVASITSYQQGGVDTVTTAGQVNYIYNTSPNAAPISTYINAGSAGGQFYYRNNAGAKEVWGLTAALSTAGAAPASSSYTLNFPANFFNTIPQCFGTVSGVAGNSQYSYIGPNSSPTTAAWTFYFIESGGSNANTSGASLYCRGF